MENYSLLMGAAAVMKMAVEMAAVSMEKPSGGTSPLRQGAGTEILSPRSWLRDGGGSGRFLWVSSIGIGFSDPGALYRRRGGAGGLTGGPHHRAARPRVDPHGPRVWPPYGPPSAVLRSLCSLP